MKKLLTLTLLVLAVAALTFTGCDELKKLSKKKAEEQVTVDLHVMSQCPFGVKAENGFRPVVEKLGPALDFNLHFIGNVNKNGSFRSLHGESEVQGDFISICAVKHNPDKYLDLLTCMNKNYRKIPGNFEACAKETGVNYEVIKKCADGKEGKKLLTESFEYSKKQGAKGSPTIMINGEKHRGGRTEAQLMRAVCSEYKKSKPEACKNIPEPTKVTLTVLTDKRCKKCGRRVAGISRSLKSRFSGMETKKVFYETDAGKKLYEEMKKNGQDKLPLFLFDKAVKEAQSYAKAKRWLTPVGDKIMVRAPAKFDPTAEICDNQKDDTGNGKADCDDPDCKEQLVCREKIKNKLDLFVMSHCPYGTRALNAMVKVLEVFGNNIDFDIHYIANKKGNKFNSLHGQPEVDENIRELCAIKHFPKNHKYMEYISCRNKKISSTKWKSCAKNGINVKVMEKCFSGKEGKKLLEEDIKIANDLGIGASPTWLANNKHKFSGIDAARVQQMLCKYNPDNPGCKTKIKPDKKKKKVKGSCG